MKKELPEFDVLLEMAQKRPEQLESLRVELIEQIICSASEDVQRRLRGLQFKVDTTRRTSKTPLASCIRISQMMFDSLERLREALNNAGRDLGDWSTGQGLSSSSSVAPVGGSAMPEAWVAESLESFGVAVGDAPAKSMGERGDNVVSMLTYRARRGSAARDYRF